MSSHLRLSDTVQYVIVGRHRLAWVNYGEIIQSKADLMHFSMELAKKLDIWYRNPPLPVDLSILGGNLNEAMGRLSSLETRSLVNPTPLDPAASNNGEPDITELQNQFRPKLDWQR